MRAPALCDYEAEAQLSRPALTKFSARTGGASFAAGAATAREQLASFTALALGIARVVRQTG
jgi:hypothetical protein